MDILRIFQLDKQQLKHIWNIRGMKAWVWEVIKFLFGFT